MKKLLNKLNNLLVDVIYALAEKVEARVIAKTIEKQTKNMK